MAAGLRVTQGLSVLLSVALPTSVLPPFSQFRMCHHLTHVQRAGKRNRAGGISVLPLRTLQKVATSLFLIAH